MLLQPFTISQAIHDQGTCLAKSLLCIQRDSAAQHTHPRSAATAARAQTAGCKSW
jgi:hypothetical protein